MRVWVIQLAGLVLCAHSACAGVITGFTSRVTFAGDDTLYWGTTNDQGTKPSVPYTVTSTGGIVTTASIPAGEFQILVQGMAPAFGNFSSGEVLLFASGTDGPISINFVTPVTGFGTQVQRNNFGAFDATVSAYDISNVLLGTFTNPNGFSDSSGDGSAIFVGVKSSLKDIYRIEISVNGGGMVQPGASGPLNELLINYVSFDTSTPQGPVTGVPEPSTFVFAGAALAWLAWKRRTPQS